MNEAGRSVGSGLGGGGVRGGVLKITSSKGEELVFSMPFLTGLGLGLIGFLSELGGLGTGGGLLAFLSQLG